MPNRKTAYINEAPVISIKAGVAHAIYRSGDQAFDRATSIRVLKQTHDRIGRALERYANGEQDIIVDD